MTSRFAVALVIFTVGIVCDVVSTYVAISSGEFVEGSPVGRLLVHRFGLVSGLILTKGIGMVVIGVPIAVAGGSKRLVATGMFGGVGVLSMLAALRNVLLYVGFWP